MKIGAVTDPDGKAQCFVIREAVFMGEQNVTAEEEWDGLEDQCIHILATGPDGPAATARILPKGDAAKIQRVAVLKAYRGTGLGDKLMQVTLDHCRQQGFDRAILDSQTYAIAFYERLGFVAEGPEFDDAGIPHRHMVLNF